MKEFNIKRLAKTLGILVPVLVAGLSDYMGRKEEQAQSEKIEKLEARLSDLENANNM